MSIISRTPAPRTQHRALSRSYVTATDVAFQLADGRSLLSALTFGVGDETVGLIGANGTGKSTLLSIIAGEQVPSAGHVQRFTTRVGFLPQNKSAAPGTSIAHALGVSEVLRAITRAERGAATADDIARIGDAWELPERTHAALAEVGLGHLTLDRSLASLSGGEATRVALAAQWLAQPDLLLLDEPTNDLDSDSREAVYSLIARWARGLLVVTHDRALLTHVQRILAIEDGKLVAYGGNWDVYLSERERQRTAAERQRESAAAQLVRAKRDAQIVRDRQSRREAAGRSARERGGIPKILLNTRAGNSEATSARMAKTVARVIESAEQRLQDAAARAKEREPLTIHVATTKLPSRTVVVELRDVTVAVGEQKAEPLLQHVSLVVMGPERIAITGPNGSGKTTLLQVIAGYTAPLAGEVYRGVSLNRVTYLDQHASLLDAGQTVRDAFTAYHPDLDVTGVRAALARFHFRANAALQSVQSLSGGERMRAALACVLAGQSPPQCLLLDEPTNHLDLDSLDSVEQALRAYDGALLVVSHDAAFLSAIGVRREEPVSRWRV